MRRTDDQLGKKDVDRRDDKRDEAAPKNEGAMPHKCGLAEQKHHITTRSDGGASLGQIGQ
jgi:hypothetical protein